MSGQLGMRHRSPRRAASRLREMSSVEQAYVGALIDGEGYFGRQVNFRNGRRHPYYNVMVANCDVELISALVRATRIPGVGAKGWSRTTRKQGWIWYSGRALEVIALATAIVPYSVKAQAFLEGVRDDEH